MNKILLMGRIGSEIELKEIGENCLAKFSLATSERWKNKSGEKQEKTSWHNITAWGNIAKTIHRYSYKGKRVLVEGKIDYRTWDKDDGSKGYATDIIANNISIIDFADNGEEIKQENSTSISTQDLPF